ncbi:MAG TPA: Hsp20/alpha crystallin family protein [Gemmatimonadaceae bacterium]|nr:Hsp20/alpha crystallin family protein [Gemmatimonadaceae bacterium]
MAYRGSGLTPFVGADLPLFGLRREIDRLFNDVTGGARWSPAVDVRENDQELDIDFELPGMKPEDVNINVENGILSVSGEKRAERKEGEEGRYHMVERSYGSFFRSFQLPQGVDESQIKAEFDNGLLTVRIPKAALPQPRRIQIGQASGEREVKTTPTRETASGRGSARGESGAQQGERMAANAPESGQQSRQESSKK